MGKGKPVDIEKLRSIGSLREGFKTSTRKTMKGRHGGSETEHWDGRQDAHVVAKPIRVKLNQSQE